ncbi:15904_t:CDS:10 [Gigaspora rosea]|nr:15904_t:CDS:10 [Gigaspora rosea]
MPWDTYFDITPPEEYRFLDFYKYRQRQEDFTFSFQKEASRLRKSLDLLILNGSKEAKNNANRRLLVVLRRGKPHTTKLGILRVAQFMVLRGHRGHYKDIDVFWNNIENNLVDTTIKTREKELHLAEIGAACSVMNSTTAVLQSAIGRVDTTLKSVGTRPSELVNDDCTKKIKHIEDSPTAANSELEYDYGETDTDGPYDVDEANEIQCLTEGEIVIRGQLLTILNLIKKDDVNLGKTYMTSVCLNQIIDFSDVEIKRLIEKYLNNEQQEWLYSVLMKKSWNPSDDYKQYIEQFREGVCNRAQVPMLVRKTFVEERFDPYFNEGHDIVQHIFTHCSVRLEAPRSYQPLRLERSYSIDTVVYIINRIFRMHQDVINCGWIEITTPSTKKRKFDGVLKIERGKGRIVIAIIEFSKGIQASLTKECDDHVKLCRNAMRNLNCLLQSVSKEKARIYLIQSANGYIKVEYLMRPLPGVYILDKFTEIKIPESFDEFEAFAEKFTELMNFQADVLSTVRSERHAQKGPPKKQEISEYQPSSPRSPCPGDPESPLME